MAINWNIEWPEIVNIAAEYCVDPMFVAAIRRAENGGPGREFGVLSEPTDGYDGQLRACCASVRQRLAVYRGNPLGTIQAPNNQRNIYTLGFLTWFAYGDQNQSGWCPKGAANDPNGLNKNWAGNVANGYYASAALGRIR